MDRIVKKTIRLIERVDKKSRESTTRKMLAEKKKQFANYGANDWDKEQFPANEPETIRRKNGRDKPLYDTGRLKRSLHMSDSQDFTSLSANDVVDKRGRNYTEFAQDYVPRKGGKHNYNEISDKELDGAIDFYINKFIAGIKSGSQS